MSVLPARDRFHEGHLASGGCSRVLAHMHHASSLRTYKGGLWVRGDEVDFVFKTWRCWSIWKVHDRAIHLRKRSETGGCEGKMAASIDRALHANATRQAWKLMKVLGGKGRRERKRNVRDVKRFDPSPQEWAEAMAEVVPFLEEGGPYDRKLTLEVDPQGGSPPRFHAVLPRPCLGQYPGHEV